jgi:hemoglobin
MDITGRDDIYRLVELFYKKLMNDAEMIHFFEEFMDPDKLEKHLIVLVDFWDNILFYSGTYKKNAMRPHLQLQYEKPFNSNHFDVWLHHFNSSVDELFDGEMAYATKSRARSIATVMRIKIAELNK